MGNYKSKQKLWKIHVEEYFLVKLQTLRLQFCRQKWTQSQIFFNLFVYILGAPPSKQTSKKQSNSFEIFCMLYYYSFSAVKARSFEWLTDGKSLIKTRFNRLINSVCFRGRSVTKKEKHGNYSVKIDSEIYCTWYMKVRSKE